MTAPGFPVSTGEGTGPVDTEAEARSCWMDGHPAVWWTRAPGSDKPLGLCRDHSLVAFAQGVELNGMQTLNAALAALASPAVPSPQGPRREFADESHLGIPGGPWGPDVPQGPQGEDGRS